MMKMYFTTTDSFSNNPILAYVGIVCANVVVGTNVFSDFAASFTDLFGGKSTTYQRQLQQMRDIAFEDLKRQTIQKGGNAIVGIKMDFDELSGKGKAMFMVSISGTACIVKPTEMPSNETEKTIVSIDDLSFELRRREYLKTLHASISHIDNEEIYNFLCEHPQSEIMDDLINVALTDNIEQIFREKTVALLRHYDNADLKCSVYKRLHNAEVSNGIYSLMHTLNLFDVHELQKLWNEGLGKRVLSVLAHNVQAQSYTKQDLLDMSNLYETIINTPDKGSIIKKDKTLLHKGGERYICPNNHENPLDVQYCSKCGEDIKGFTAQNIQAIEKFKDNIDALQVLFSES